jgi:hypothetical protein
VELQHPLHTENTCNGRLDQVQTRGLDKSFKVSPEFRNAGYHGCGCGTLSSHLKNGVAGFLSTLRIEVGDKGFVGINAFAEASGGMINGFI